MTVADIAAAAHLSVPSVYRQFGDKTGMMDAVFAAELERGRRALLAHLELQHMGALPRGTMPYGWYGRVCDLVRPGSTMGALLRPPDGLHRIDRVADALWPVVAPSYPTGPQPWGVVLPFGELIRLAVLVAHFAPAEMAAGQLVGQAIRFGLTGRLPTDGPDPNEERRFEEWLSGTSLLYEDLEDDPATPPADGAPCRSSRPGKGMR